MSVIAKWDGAGVADGTAMGPTVGATADTKFDLYSIYAGGSITVKNGGLYSPRLEVVPPPFVSGQQEGAYWAWMTALGGGTFPQHALRFYYETAGLPTANSAGIASVRNSVNEPLWWLDVSITGILRLRNNLGTALSLSQQPVPLNTALRIEGAYDNGVLKVYLYRGESQIPIETLSASGLDTQSMLNPTGNGFIQAQQVRFGTPNNADKLAHSYWDNMAFANTADLIGPVNPGSSSPFSYWDGSKETALVEYGVWDGAALQYYSDTPYLL